MQHIAKRLITVLQNTPFLVHVMRGRYQIMGRCASMAVFIHVTYPDLDPDKKRESGREKSFHEHVQPCWMGDSMSMSKQPVHLPIEDTLRMIWFCYNTKFPYTPARVYSGLVFNTSITHYSHPAKQFHYVVGEHPVKYHTCSRDDKSLAVDRRHLPVPSNSQAPLAWPSFHGPWYTLLTKYSNVYSLCTAYIFISYMATTFP